MLFSTKKYNFTFKKSFSFDFYVLRDTICPMKILLLEDDYSYRKSIKDFLLSCNFEVEDFENGEFALQAIFSTHYDLLLLDVRVPGMNGYEIVKNVRENEIDVPIILVTSLTDIEDLSTGYEIGCNDYIRKPFVLKELKYRINQTIGRFHFQTNQNRIKLAEDFCFNLETYKLCKNSEPIPLTNLEQKILIYLIKKAGAYTQTSELIDNIWSENEIVEADLRMHIKRIRDKTSKTFITNSRGLGYKIEKK